MAGSKGGRGGRGGAGPIIPAPTPQQPAQKTDEQIISDALGTQGTAATIGEAVERVNPNYTPGKRDEWSTNCQRCVWAVEMQRRGYDVEALPRTSDDDYAMPDTKYAKSFLNVASGGLELETVGSPFWKSSASDFKAHFTNKYDIGARGMIVCQSGKGGHVFNWEIIQGKSGKQVRFFDGQIAKLGNEKAFGINPQNRSVSQIQSKWFYFREARMDNVDVTALIADYVKPRK